MARVQIIDDDAKDTAGARPTGRFRWWQPISGGRELQQEWEREWPPNFWVTIPTLVELSE